MKLITIYSLAATYSTSANNAVIQADRREANHGCLKGLFHRVGTPQNIGVGTVPHPLPVGVSRT
jgi:hypothetical protein